MATRLSLAISCLVSVLLLACSGGDLEVDAPDGWTRFSEGAFRGAIHEDWVEIYVNAAELEGQSVELPEAIESALDAFIAAGNSEVFFVYMEQEPVNGFVTNINVLPSCEIEEVRALVTDPVKLAEYYTSVGVPAAPDSRVEFDGRDFVILKLQIQADFDSYQVYIEKDGCLIPATLTTRKDETQWVQDFGTFISYLEPNVNALRQRGTPTP